MTSISVVPLKITCDHEVGEKDKRTWQDLLANWSSVGHMRKGREITIWAVISLAKIWECHFIE